MNKKITILIQGPYDETSLKKIDEYLKFAKVFYSSWNESEPKLKDLKSRIDNNDFNFVTQKSIQDYEIRLLGIYNPANLYRQLLTTIKGLENIDTEFFLKIRSDANFSNMQELAMRVMNEPEKIFVADIFFRPPKICNYHISDHIFGGKTQFFLNALQKCKSNLMKSQVYLRNAYVSNINTYLEKNNIINLNIPPESFIGAYLLDEKDEGLKKFTTDECISKYKSHLRLINVADLRPFEVKYKAHLPTGKISFNLPNFAEKTDLDTLCNFDYYLWNEILSKNLKNPFIYHIGPSYQNEIPTRPLSIYNYFKTFGKKLDFFNIQSNQLLIFK